MSQLVTIILSHCHTLLHCVLILCVCLSGDDDQLTADVTTLATWGDSDSTDSDSSSSTSSDDSDDEGGEVTPNEQEIEDDGEFICKGHWCVLMYWCDIYVI